MLTVLMLLLTDRQPQSKEFVIATLEVMVSVIREGSENGVMTAIGKRGVIEVVRLMGRRQEEEIEMPGFAVIMAIRETQRELCKEAMERCVCDKG